MKFSAGFTLFYPSKEEIEIILNCTKVFDQIYIFDNTDEFDTQQINKVSFIKNEKVKYMSFNENMGLSVALNKICKISLIDGFEYVCLFDQDSFISESHLINMFNLITDNKDESIGLFCPKIIYDSTVKSDYIDSVVVNSISEIDWTITSGSFINLKIFKLTNGFDENYFIDRLDYDYCFYLKKMGYKISQINDAHLFQQLGDSKHLMGLKVSEHNAIRHYYVFRNRLYFYLSKQFSIANFIKIIILSTKHLFTILLETNRIVKIKVLWLSIIDYSQGKMGKFAH